MMTRRTAAPERRAPGIRRIAIVSALTFGAVALIAVAAVTWTSSLLERSVATVIRDTQSQAIASEIEVKLLTYQRLANLYVATGEPELATARVELAAKMRRLLAQAHAFLSSEEERYLLEDISEQLSLYLREREQLETRRPGLEHIARLTRPALNRTVESLHSLRDLNDAQVRRADGEALRVNRLSNLAASTAGALLIVGLLAATLGVRRYMLRPIMELHRTVARLRSGDADARASEAGLRELSELAQGLNEMADSLARQRADQLTFLAGVAHDLRNPLSGLKFGILALEHEGSESRRNRTRTLLDRQVDRLARMVDDLLDATRIEAGTLELRSEIMDVRDVVEDTIGLYAPTSPDHQIRAKVPTEPVRIHGDPLRIEQVLSNLVSNAIKFSPTGGAITISLAAENGRAVLSVSDHGIGIPAAERTNIFLPFRRRRPDVAPGAGLGLSVVRRIAVAHGGTVEVDSEPGLGSTFRVRLPLAPERQPRSDAQPPCNA